MPGPIFPFTAIVNQDKMKRALVLNAINPLIGGVLVRGERGTAKSTAVRALAKNPGDLEGWTMLARSRLALGQFKLLAPVERQEVWAAGVTYLRSKKARMEESDFSASTYDRVYDAPRPEIFFKSLPEKVVVPGDAVGIRRDARWNVPEPELALVLNSRGQIVGFKIGRAHV